MCCQLWQHLSENIDEKDFSWGCLVAYLNPANSPPLFWWTPKMTGFHWCSDHRVLTQAQDCLIKNSGIPAFSFSFYTRAEGRTKALGLFLFLPWPLEFLKHLPLACKSEKPVGPFLWETPAHHWFALGPWLTSVWRASPPPLTVFTCSPLRDMPR